MVEAAPPVPFIIAKPQFLLEFLIIALDSPPQLLQITQVTDHHGLPSATSQSANCTLIIDVMRG